jgi:hypothetical protein
LLSPISVKRLRTETGIVSCLVLDKVISEKTKYYLCGFNG